VLHLRVGATPGPAPAAPQYTSIQSGQGHPGRVPEMRCRFHCIAVHSTPGDACCTMRDTTAWHRPRRHSTRWAHEPPHGRSLYRQSHRELSQSKASENSWWCMCLSYALKYASRGEVARQQLRHGCHADTKVFMACIAGEQCCGTHSRQWDVHIVKGVSAVQEYCVFQDSCRIKPLACIPPRRT